MLLLCFDSDSLSACEGRFTTFPQNPFSFSLLGLLLPSVIQQFELNEKENSKKKKKKMVMGLSVLGILDLVVAGVSLMIGLSVFAFIASILCSVAFLHNAKDLA